MIEVSIPQGFHEYDAEEMVVQRNKRIEELEAKRRGDIEYIAKLNEHIDEARTRIRELESYNDEVQTQLTYTMARLEASEIENKELVTKVERLRTEYGVPRYPYRIWQGTCGHLWYHKEGENQCPHCDEVERLRALPLVTDETIEAAARWLNADDDGYSDMMAARRVARCMLRAAESAGPAPWHDPATVERVARVLCHGCTCQVLGECADRAKEVIRAVFGSNDEIRALFRPDSTAKPE